MLLKEWIKQPLLIWITVYLSLHSRNKAHSTVVVVKLWIYENHMCELLSEELSEVWSFNFFFLSAFLFATAKVAYITAMIILHLILHSAVHIYDFHIFIISPSSFHRFITSQFNDLLPVGLLAELVERRAGIAEVKGSNLVQARSGFLVATVKVAYKTAMIILH